MIDYFKIMRYFLYTIGIFIFYAIERVPESLVYFFTGARPVYLVPLALVISALENKKAGIVFCIFIGILIDLDFNYKLGFFTIIIPFFSIILNKVKEKITSRNFVFINVSIMFSVILIFILEFLFFCILKNHKGLLFEFFNFYIPKIGYTSLTIPVFYLFNKAIFTFLNKENRVTNERAR